MPDPSRRHPSDETLLALASEGESRRVGRADREHALRCGACGERIGALRELRRLVTVAGATVTPPPRDLARGALKRLRARRSSIGTVNELFDVVVTIVRGLSTLLSVDETAGSDGRPAGPPRPRGTRG